MRLSSSKHIRALLKRIQVDQRIPREPGVWKLREEALLEAVEHTESVGLPDGDEVVRVSDFRGAGPDRHRRIWSSCLFAGNARDELSSTLDDDRLAPFIMFYDDSFLKDFTWLMLMLLIVIIFRIARILLLLLLSNDLFKNNSSAVDCEKWFACDDGFRGSW